MNQSDKRSASVPDILRNAANQLDVPTVGLEAIRLHGASRRHRRRAVIASTCAVLVIGTGVVAVQQLSETRDRSTAPGIAPDSAPDSTTATSGSVSEAPSNDAVPVTRVEPAFVWNAVTPGSAEAIGSLVFGIGVTDEAPYLAWSSAPGLSASGEFVPTLYRSDDGIRWVPASASAFTEPDVSRRGLAVQGDTLFAFGTAAATAAIPKGGAGDAVVDISNDGGATWEHLVLPIDLRGLAATEGVNSVGLSGAMAAANGVVVVVAQPTVFWDAQMNPPGENLAVTAQGAYSITYPTCPTSTGCVGTATDGTNTDDTLPVLSDLIPLSDLGIDQASVDAARTPRAFFSTDGATFTEATLPPVPDEVMPAGGFDMRVFAAGGQFYAAFPVSTDPSLPDGFPALLVYRSADGVNWEQVGDLTSFTGKELLGVLPDGTLVARPYTYTGSTGISTSLDGVAWVAHDLSPLIEASDGDIVIIDLWAVTVGDQGITVVGNVINDPIAEAGGRFIERDGVRLEVQSSLNPRVRVYDDDTGDEIPEDRVRYLDSGGIEVLADNGSVLTSFTVDEWNGLMMIDQAGSRITKVLMHSDDGQNWSRENVADLTGSNDANPGFIQQHEGNVLINLIDNSRRIDGLPITVVLVGTRK